MSKSGFVTIVGRPNVGKSTFLNQIIGEKVAIMSDKAQTTKNIIQGIYTDKENQIVFIDTPGIHKPKHELGRVINKMATSTLEDVDVILFMVSYDEKLGAGDEYILELLKRVSTPVFLLINKIDLAKNKNDVLNSIVSYMNLYPFKEIIPLSAKTNDNVKHLLDVIVPYLNEGPFYYPEHVKTNHPEKFIMQEIIREKVLKLTREEIPHSIAVVITHQIEAEDGYLHLHANIVVERKSQKGIIIGKQGRMLSRIGTEARKEIKKRLNTPIFLDLWVKVEKDWRNNPNKLHEYGYDMDDY